jgi:ribosome biogenesis protein Nip4
MVIQISTKLNKNDFLLIFNQNNELIAIAISKVDYNLYQRLNPNDLVALNLVDKGYYLRVKQ